MSTDVVPVSQIRNLPEVVRENAVTAYLAQARDRLADALVASGPESVASIKAEVATVAEMSKQLGLSKECRDDAAEMVRRAEYALGKVIRKGQSEGVIAARGDFGAVGPGGRSSVSDDLRKPSEFLGNSGQENHQTYAMSDASPEEFDEALSEARAEGNLSRANVVRKVKRITGADLSVETACGIDNSFADGLRGVRSWLDTLTTNPTPEQADALANTLRRYLKKLERSMS
jgi:hypothetical protein